MSPNPTRTARSPDGTRLAAGSEDGTLRLLETGSDKTLWSLSGFDDVTIGSIDFSPDGQTLAATFMGPVFTILRTEDGALVAELPCKARQGVSVRYSPDGETDLPRPHRTPQQARIARGCPTWHDGSDGSTHPNRRLTRSGWSARSGTWRRSPGTWT